SLCNRSRMPFDSPSPPTWTRVAPDNVSGWLEDAEALWNASEDEKYLGQNARYLVPWTRTEGHDAWVYELREAGLVAYAALDVGPSTLDLLVGEIALHRHKIE